MGRRVDSPDGPVQAHLDALDQGQQGHYRVWLSRGDSPADAYAKALEYRSARSRMRAVDLTEGRGRRG